MAYYFSTIPSCLAWEMRTNYLGIGLEIRPKIVQIRRQELSSSIQREKKTRPFHIVERTRTLRNVQKVTIDRFSVFL